MWKTLGFMLSYILIITIKLNLNLNYMNGDGM